MGAVQRHCFLDQADKTCYTYDMEKIVLGLGSNVGDSLLFLKNAVKAISRITENIRVSSVYKTKPQDYLAQADFLNMVVTADYAGTPDALFTLMQKIEKENGRDGMHKILKGPRTLDIDILLFGSRIIETENIIVPHPAMKKRQFVLIPLLEIFPESADPISKEPYAKILSTLDDQGVRFFCKL